LAFSDKSIDYLNRKVAGMYHIIKNCMADMEAKAKRNAEWKDRTSHARQNIHHGVESHPMTKSFTAYLAHGMKYGRYLEEGTKPHIIKPKRKKALYWKGAKHPVKSVNHPGTKAYPILEETLRENKDELIKAIEKHWANE